VHPHSYLKKPGSIPESFEAKVETPIHGNDLIVTPIIAPQSG
jgi:hypothetical protein